MATTQTGGMTWEQFRALPDSDEYRHTELIDGVLVHKFAQRLTGAILVNAPSRMHQRVAARLWQQLDAWAHEEPGRGEPTHELTLYIDEHNGYIPDVLWYPEDRRPPEPEEFEGPPALVIEVLSPSTRAIDERRKLADYARVGVDELWLVDAKAPAAQVYRRAHPDAIEFALVAELDEEGELTSPLLPGFSVQVGLLLQR